MNLTLLQALVFKKFGSVEYLSFRFNSNIRNNPLRLDGSFPMRNSKSNKPVSGNGKQEHRAECRFKPLANGIWRIAYGYIKNHMLSTISQFACLPQVLPNLIKMITAMLNAIVVMIFPSLVSLDIAVINPHLAAIGGKNA